MANVTPPSLSRWIRASPSTTLLRNLSLPAKERARRTLHFMRFRETWLLFDVISKIKESDSHANESTLCQQNLLTTQIYFLWHASSGASGLQNKESASCANGFLVPDLAIWGLRVVGAAVRKTRVPLGDVQHV